MKLPNPIQQYGTDWQARQNTLIERMDDENVKKGRDNYMGDGRIILTSPNGTNYAITVDDTGQLYSTNVELDKEMGGLNLDAFGRLSVSQAFTLFDSQQEYGLDTRTTWDATANGSLATASSNGSVTSGSNAVGPRNSNTRMVPITCSSTNGHYSILQSRQYLRYIPGKSHLILITGIFATASSPSISIVRRTSTGGSMSDSASVAQADWNVDKFDGTGPSKITLDLTKTQILFIQAQWLGVGRVVVGFDIDGQLYPAHEFLNANNLTVPYTQAFNLPVRLEVQTVSTTTEARVGYFDGSNGIFVKTVNTGAGGTINFICASVQTEGGLEARGFPWSASNGTTTIGVTTRRPVLSIRPKSTFNSITNRGHIELIDFNISASTNASYYEIVVGGTLTGASFASVGNDSITEFDTAATAISGGYTIISGFVAAGTGASREVQSGDVDIRNPLTLSQINALTATQTPITIVCTSMAATSNVSASMNWHEQVI